MDKTKYDLEKLISRKTGYPVATIAYYGPDDQRGTKVVVGILLSEKDEEVAQLKKWFDEEYDIRANKAILQEILEFIQANHARRVVISERIIGCPHEEGIDYPAGETCPHCPFWANRDRWTGEIIS